MAETTKSERQAPPDVVKGDLEPATADGFAALLHKANVFLAKKDNEGYRLLTILRLEKAIAAVYVRGKPNGITEFWEEDDNEV